MSAPATARAEAGDTETQGSGAQGPPPRSGRRRALLNLLHLAALWGFAVAQPLFDLLGRNAEFFATRGSEGLEVVAFGLGLALVPPAAMAAVELVAGMVARRLARALHLLFVAALVLLLAIQVLKRVGGLGAAAILILAALVGVAAAVAYARARGLRTFLTALAPAPLVFLALFLVASPAAKLVFADEAGARSAGVAARAPVVLIVFDELPLTSLLDAREEIDRRGYPHFAALADTSSWFPNATGVHDRTSKAVPSILTGRRPRPGGLPIAADHPNSLFTLLGGSYRMNVHEEATSVCPDELCGEGVDEGGLGGRARSLGSDLAVVFGHVALPQELADRLPSVSEGWEGFAGAEESEGGEAAQEGSRPRGREQVGELARDLTRGLRGGRGGRFERFVRSLGGGEDRVLSFEHAFFPHAPFEHLPSGRRYARPNEEPVEGLIPASGEEPLRDPFAATQAYQRHLLQAAYTDRLLGQVIDRLRSADRFDRSLILVTADHGATFQTGQDRRAVTRGTFADVASVPLIVKAPGQDEGRVNEGYAQTVDIVPTIADVLGVRLPWRADGRSAFDPAVRQRRSVTMVQGSERRARISRGEDDRPITVAASELENGQRAALERKLALFGASGDPASLGPRGDLRRRPLAELPVRPGSAAEARATIDDPRELRAVDPASGFAPAHLTGRVRSERPRKRTLAVAVNGRIAATAETFFLRGDGVERLSVMLPEAALRPGPNTVEVLEVQGEGSATRLVSLGRSGSPPR